MNLDKLSAMQNQVFTAMIESPTIFENFSTKLKNNILKAGVATVMATLLFSSTIAQANDNGLRAMLGVSAVSGLLSSNAGVSGLPPECSGIVGVSGLKVGGVMGAGSYVGNQIGGGNGKTIATVLLGFLGGAVALNSEANRIEQAKSDCMKRIAENQARSNNSYPNYSQNQQLANSTVLYVFNNSNNYGKTFVTLENSPGINALHSVHDGSKNIETDPEVLNAVNRAIEGLQNAYKQFQISSDKYIKLLNETHENTKSARYAVNEYDTRQAEVTIKKNKVKIQGAIKEWDMSFNNYAKERAFTAAIFDNAAIDGYKLSPYADTIALFTPPQNATVACNCVIPNRYSTVSSALTSGR